jgi:hypothetical protein
MKSLTMKMMVVTATLVVAGGVASAQSMKAEIPFRFKAAGAWLEPGTYSINRTSAVNALYRIANLDAAGAVVALPQFTMNYYNGDATQGKLVFECVAGQCALVQLWDGPRGIAYAFSRPKRSKQEGALASLISIRMERGE